MSRVRPGDVLACEVCGLSVIVDEECGCAIAELICCEEPMENKVETAEKSGCRTEEKSSREKGKSTEKAAAAPKKKAVVKKAKPAAKNPFQRKQL